MVVIAFVAVHILVPDTQMALVIDSQQQNMMPVILSTPVVASANLQTFDNATIGTTGNKNKIDNHAATICAGPAKLEIASFIGEILQWCDAFL